MKQLFSLLILGSILHLGACKKEECPEPDTPYTSTMSGKTSSGLQFQLVYAGTMINQGCNGWFIKEVYNSTGDYEYLRDFSIQVVEGLSDSIKEWNNHHEKEFIIDFEFIGTGYECIYIDGLTEYTVLPSPGPIEQVKITHIEEAS